MSAEPATVARPGRRYSGWRLALVVGRVVALAVLGYVAVQVVISNSDELSGASAYLRGANWGWIALAVVAEGFSYLNFTLLQKRLLASGGVQVGIARLTAISFAGNAIANSLPGGGAFATVFAYRQFRRRGADEALTTWTIVAFTALTAIALAMLALVGLLLAGPNGPVGGLWVLVIPLIAGPVAGVCVLLWPHLLARAVLPPLAWIKRLTGLPRQDAGGAVRRLVERLETVTPGLSDWLWGLLFSAGNWVADCLCLVVAFEAVGAGVPWKGLLVAYGAAQVAASLPITPGGLGVVEGSLTVALVAFGGSTAGTVAAVLLYRIISFWLVLPIGWVSWLGLQLEARRETAAASAVAP